jgi:hypothetical protein
MGRSGSCSGEVHVCFVACPAASVVRYLVELTINVAFKWQLNSFV